MIGNVVRLRPAAIGDRVEVKFFDNSDNEVWISAIVEWLKQDLILVRVAPPLDLFDGKHDKIWLSPYHEKVSWRRIETVK